MSNHSLTFTILLGTLPTALRLRLLRLFQGQPDWHVVSSGEGDTNLLTTARRLRPGLIIVAQDQLRDIEQLRRSASIPVLLFGETPPLPGMLREVAAWGVYGYFQPDSGQPLWAAELLSKVRQAMPAAPRPLAQPTASIAVPGIATGLVIVGGSTGGTLAVEQLVRALPTTLACAVLVAVHLPASFLTSFVDRLRRATALPVVAGGAGVLLQPGQIVVAPGGRNTLVRAASNSPWQAWHTEFTAEPSPSGDEPSLDVIMRSAARTVGRNVLGVVLTGLGRDGTLGAQAIRQHGGTVLVQDEASSAVFSMPKSVIQAGWANAVLPLHELPKAIGRHVSQFKQASAEARLSRLTSARAF
ncbi:CheB methylesterase domain-containing protein [Hymenobacter canadensis]|uniref:protein-glutamate methylesterase n=1 Tax=Hymenobacter canadensis TaxID=2999067 RepID=A0ABY7LS68_9BACT|nr:CheB methylesterase domain-containing protein [Hymenobacter canadensis]WBA42689.1 CheB methylesterase domain-containing protein [Hymenobacter canadensis]